jgi:hypothetical protein
MSVAIRNSSRLIYSDLLKRGEVEFWDFSQYPEIIEQEEDIFYEVDSLDRLDKIAYKFYNDSGLWWVIALANNMRFLPNDLQTGKVIRIPSFNYVAGELLTSI